MVKISKNSNIFCSRMFLELLLFVNYSQSRNGIPPLTLLHIFPGL